MAGLSGKCSLVVYFCIYFKCFIGWNIGNKSFGKGIGYCGLGRVVFEKVYYFLCRIKFFD